MALISFDAAVFDPLGDILIDAAPGSAMDASTRRVTRTATLDGNSAIVDNGYTASDSTLKINARLDRAKEATLLRIMRIYPEVIAATDGGCFLGVIDDYRKDQSGQSSIEFIIQRSLSLIADLP